MMGTPLRYSVSQFIPYLSFIVNCDILRLPQENHECQNLAYIANIYNF